MKQMTRKVPPPFLKKPQRLSTPQNYDEAAFQLLRLELHPNDGMFAENHDHYLFVGAAALNVIKAHQALAYAKPPASILDFGAGAGRVTRWLRAGFPNAEITVSDIRKDDIEFCIRAFNAKPWITGTDIATLQPPKTFDLIWAGSVFTHLPRDSAIALLRKFTEWLNPSGLAVLSLHGREWYKHFMKEIVQKMPDKMGVPIGFDGDGYGYADYLNQKGYGLSMAKPRWVVSAAEGLPDCRIVAFGERNWGSHDVLTVERVTDFKF